MKAKTKIFITGGTFDKEYNEITGELYFKSSHMYELLELGRCRLDVDIETLMMVESMEMSKLKETILFKNALRSLSSE